MTWFTATSATVLNGGIIVSINNGDDIEIAQVAGGLIIGTNPPVEIKRTYLDGLGDKKIELRSAWPYASQTAQPAVAFPTDADLAEATKVLRQLIDGFAIASQVEAEDGVYNLKTMTPLRTKQAILKQTKDLISSSGIISAMSQAQFEAIRVQNKDRYAASGWVSFGNHESGKQVNECKSGLYTALTTPNTLLIGKSGGVGGSKTDAASVHIDGVVFNLTNQFVLTLPSHPTSIFPERMDMYGVESEKVEISSTSPNAYQGGLRGVGEIVNLFTATDQQKKDFFAQNSNTTYIGSDGKIYQWQLYAISFSGTTDGVPSPSEQGYSLNSFGDLWLKAGKNLLYFGNVLRLNDGGYHLSFNPLGTAKFVGDTYWYNTETSITSRADCFNPSKLLTGSGSIASGKSGRPEIGGRYYDAVYASGFGGVCRDMRYSAYGIDIVDCAEEDTMVKNGAYRGFEKLVITRIIQVAVDEVGSYIGGHYIGSNVGDFTSLADKQYSLFYNKTRNIIGYIPVVETANLYLSTNPICKGLPNTATSASGMTVDPYTGTQVGDEFYLIAGSLMTNSVGGSFLQTDVIGNPANILATPALANGWQGSWGGIAGTGGVNKVGTRKNINGGDLTYSVDNGVSWNKGNFSPRTDNIVTDTYSDYEIRICQYQAFSTQTEWAPNAVLSGLVPYNIFVSSDYRPENGALLGESLIGKVLKNNVGVSVNNKSLSSCAIDGSGKLTSATNFDGVTHPALTLGAPANNSPAFKAISYLTNINQQAFIQYTYTELKHNGSNWGDDGKQTIVDNQSTKPNDHNVTISVGTARLREPIGWFKNKD